MGNHVFLCYARPDHNFVFRLANDLKSRGVPVWLDQWDIPQGANWIRSISKAIAECARFLLILSPAAMESDDVQGEWLTALDKRKTVIPVLYQERALFSILPSPWPSPWQGEGKSRRSRNHGKIRAEQYCGVGSGGSFVVVQFVKTETAFVILSQSGAAAKNLAKQRRPMRFFGLRSQNDKCLTRTK